MAQRLNAKVAGTIADIKIPKATQFGETDWVFLVRLAREYGYEVKLTNNNKTIAVVKVSTATASVRTLRPGDVSSFRFRDKITEVPAKTEVKSYDPSKKKGVKGTHARQGKESSADTRRRTVPAKTPAQAQAIAQAEQERHETDKTALEMTLPGDTRLVAGATVTVADWGALNGTYMITEARHPISSSGYSTDIQLKRIGE